MVRASVSSVPHELVLWCTTVYCSFHFTGDYMCVRLVEVFKTVEKRNPISGHRWTEHGETIAYEVVTPGGRHRYKSEAKAVKELAEWKAFYEKYPLVS